MPPLPPPHAGPAVCRPHPGASTRPGSTAPCRSARRHSGPAAVPAETRGSRRRLSRQARAGRAAHLGEPQVGRAAGRPRPRAGGGRGEERAVRGGRCRDRDGGLVLGAPWAANAAASLRQPRSGARDEPHAEKGLLQAGRQQDRLGAAQDLPVPDARRQRGLWLRVVRSPGLCALWGTGRGAKGLPGRRGGPTAAAQVTGLRCSHPKVGDGSLHLLCSSGPTRGVPSLVEPRGRAPSTLTLDYKAQCPAGLEDPLGAFPVGRLGKAGMLSRV